MKKIFLLAALTILASSLGIRAQIVTSSPSPVQEDTQDLIVYYHADMGNKQLADLPPSTLIYAHTGVLLSTSKSDSDWKYAPTWGDNSEKYLLKYEGPNLYSLYIGDIRTYYGITDPEEKIKKLAFVFRTADKSKEGKTADNGDIFLDVLESGLQVSLETSLEGTVITPSTSKVHFKLGATEAADLSININGTDIATASDATLLETDYTFTEAGNYNVYGNAVKDGKRVSTTLKLTYTQASNQVDYPGGEPKMGAVANNDGSVTFCLAAPEKTGVIIVGSWNDYEVSNDYLMNYQDKGDFRYFWITIPDIDPSKQYIYYYLVDGDTRVGDPYAKLILDPSNDKYISSAVYPDLPAYPTGKIPGNNVSLAVYQGNINDYQWTDDDFVPVAKENLIVYELLLRDFTGTEGRANGNGTMKKALEKLPYLKALGVNCIELLPINEFNGNNSWGYNPNFYFAPDKAYGTPDDYKDFINACHENGIAVVLDMVFNQSDWQHPWYRLYPVGSNPFYNATAPHAYSVLNDWNQGYPLVRQQWKDVVKYWMEEYHVDGFRFDLVKGLGNNDSYANNGDGATNAYNSSRVKNMREIQEAMLQVNPNAIFINENLAGAQEENEMAAYGQLNWANVNYQGRQFAMGYRSDASLNRMLATNDSRTWGSTVSYLESHDEQRLAYEQDTYGDPIIKGNLTLSMRRLGSAACQMIMAPGAHMIWMFSELGNNENTKSDTGNNTSPKKVLWDYYDVPDRRGLYDSYAELITLRNDNPELFAKDAGYSLNFSGWALGRYFHSSVNGKEIHVLINPQLEGELTMKVSFGSTAPNEYTVASKSYGTTPSFDVVAGNVTVPANSYVVITNSKVVNAVEDVFADSDSHAVSQQWYDLTGRKIDNPSSGLFIKVVKYADGSVRSFKQFIPLN